MTIGPNMTVEELQEFLAQERTITVTLGLFRTSFTARVTHIVDGVERVDVGVGPTMLDALLNALAENPRQLHT